MITDSEITAVELSPTKRDFYQIWNELLDTASKLSNRWDPSSTNESDPGIVLLKVLTAIADKLNYTIDKNTLEAFMPSATQEESMRKLCDMLGYTMKYYRSATCPVQISYVGTDYDLEADNCSISIPKFTNIKNEDQDVNYVTLSDITLGGAINYDEVECMEGEEVDYDDITRDQLDDNHRYYLPEAQIAENGIFLWTKDQDVEYTKVTNLNTQKLGTRCWKFGYDSREDMPYIEFPSDIDSLIGQGIKFQYIRTNGANGNISAGLLNNMDASSCKLYTTSSSDEIDCDDSWFSVTNTAAATNGQDKETIDEAYNAYKKTIGTFDTLVSCRDYMNKIYQLTQGDIEDSSSTTPLVSNIIASDIRDDINRGVTICTFTANGTTFENQSKKDDSDKDLIDSFDILLYPFKKVNGLNTKSEYVNSFKYTDENLTEIKSGIEQNKTIAHHIISPKNTEIACIKDYIKVKAKITTIAKVNTIAENSILNKVFTALYKNFNMRKVDFGERITDEMIQEVILNADSRIKNVQLSTDHSLAFDTVSGTSMKNGSHYENTFINLAVLNVLAGRVALFNYDESFEPALNETKAEGHENVYFPSTKPDAHTGNWGVTKIEAKYEPETTEVTVNSNEVIQFRAPSFKTTVTYPSYVNYFIKLNLEEKDTKDGIAANFITLYALLDTYNNGTKYIVDFLNTYKDDDTLEKGTLEMQDTSATFDALKAKYVWLFTKESTEEGKRYYKEATSIETDKEYIYLKLNASNSINFGLISKYVSTITWYGTQTYSSIYKSMGVNTSLVPGLLIDSTFVKYAPTTTVPGLSGDGTVNADCVGWKKLYVPYPSKDYPNPENDAEAGLGQDAVLAKIYANQEYELQTGEYLLINYTSSSTDDSGSESSTVVNKIYKKGTMIRPSFDLSDSVTVHTNQSTSWSKKSGYTFDDVEITDKIDGMFTLSSNEQIEIIEPVVVTLGPDEDSSVSSNIVNIYWVRNDDAQNTTQAGEDTENILTFAWDDGDPLTYTLKENEYFFYTNKNKTDLAYYGNGTKIKRSNERVVLTRKVSTTDEATADDILQYGLAASIPWITKSLTKNDNITIHEYQYINIVEGGALADVEFVSTGETFTKLSSNWQKIKSASYYLSSTSDEQSCLSEIKIPDMSWEVRSLLQLNIGPTLIQTLHQNDSITISKTDDITSYANDPDSHYIKSDATWNVLDTFEEGVSLKANTLVQSAAQTTYMSPDALLQIKAIKLIDDDSQKIAELPIDFGNFGDNITNVSVTPETPFSLYTCIPTNSFGLIMFYVTSTDKTNPLTVTMTATGGNLLKYNSAEKKASWTQLTQLPIDEEGNGITIVYIPKDITKIALSFENKGTLTFSNLDIIPEANDNDWLNPKLGMSDISDAGNLILKQLRDYDTFYYNNIIDNGNSIRFNVNDDDDTLLNVDAWYDYNNVANKFFIPELDASYFSDCIVIDKASKLK